MHDSSLYLDESAQKYIAEHKTNDTITEEFLRELNLSDSVISFMKEHKLLGFPLSKLKDIKGDYYCTIFDIVDQNITKFYPQNENGTYTRTTPSGSIVTYDSEGRIVKCLCYAKGELVQTQNYLHDHGCVTFMIDGVIVKKYREVSCVIDCDTLKTYPKNVKRNKDGQAIKYLTTELVHNKQGQLISVFENGKEVCRIPEFNT